MQVRHLLSQEFYSQLPHGSAVWALEKDHAIIGHCLAQNIHFSEETPLWELLDFQIESVWQKKGYGTFFFKQLLREWGPDAAVWVPSQDVPGFWGRFGFVPDGQTRTDACGTLLRRMVRWREPQINALSIAHDFLKTRIQPGSFVIDATAGRGRDTAFLCRLVGPSGRVLAVDIQQDAVDTTNALLHQKGYTAFARAVCASHANLNQFARPGTVDAIMFNLGYLPGGDHSLFTESSVSLPAIRNALNLLRPGGVMTVCIYHGGPQGEEEKEALLPFLQTLDPQHYTVLVTGFPNRTGSWPIPVCIIKHQA